MPTLYDMILTTIGPARAEAFVRKRREADAAASAAKERDRQARETERAAEEVLRLKGWVLLRGYGGPADRRLLSPPLREQRETLDGMAQELAALGHPDLSGAELFLSPGNGFGVVLGDDILVGVGSLLALGADWGG